jgi:hypothetical protein
MKKLVFSSLLALGALTSTAQFLAPNFTRTDIDGTSHTLYDYLDQGYTVILDISATWCGPCWNYHNTNALKNIYVNQGPAGMAGVSATTTDKIMVMFFEGDNATNLNCLYGSAGCNSTTHGDWVTGTPYPIFNDHTIKTLYPIGGYPTIFTIFPDRYVVETGQQSANNHVNFVNNNIAAHSAANGVDASIFMYTGETSTCDVLQTKVLVQNKGDQPLPAGATVEVLNGTTVLGSGQTTQTLNQFATQEVTVPVSITSDVALTVRVTTANDVNAANNQVVKNVTIAKTSGTAVVTIEIVTDAYGSETTWNLKNQSNVTVAQGGPYTNQSSAGQYPRPSVNVSLANANCYKLTVNDSYGDGMDAGYGAGYIRIVDGWGTELIKVGEFTSVATGSMLSGTYASIEEINTIDVEVYPNPVSTTAVVTFENLVAAETTIEVTNLVGQILMNEYLGNVVGAQYIEINAADLTSGLYLVNIKSGNTITTKRIVVSK